MNTIIHIQDRFKKYYDMGYRGILFDIDNTLVRHNEPATSRAIQLMEQLKAMGFKVCLVSNNKEPRVAAFNKKMKVNYIFKAGKPSKKGYIRAMNEIGCNIDNTIAVGPTRSTLTSSEVPALAYTLSLSSL